MNTVKLLASVISGLSLAACAFYKPAPAVVTQTLVAPEEAEWKVTLHSQSAGVELIQKELPKDRVDRLRVSYVTPELRQITPHSQTKFEVYEARGIKELSGLLLVQPKVFVSTAANYGAILGFKSGKDGSAKISVPIALVNGLVDSIPTIGGAFDGAGAAIALPDKFRMTERGALEQETGKGIVTLPVCPSAFILRHHGREIVAESPFRNHSHCPINQFFRVEFEGAEAELKSILESASLREESVTLAAELVFAVEVPRKIVQLNIDAHAFERELRSLVSETDSLSVPETEERVLDAVFASARRMGIEAWYSPEVSQVVAPTIRNYFARPGDCSDSGFCRKLRSRSLQRGPVRVAWRETEALMQPILTRSVIGLGPSASVSAFEARPATQVFREAEKPNELRGLDSQAVEGICRTLDTNRLENEEGKRLRRYCIALKESLLRSGTSGYSPLGSNTQVFPGAWLRLDIRSIEEFTTAKTKTRADGTTEIASEVVNLADSTKVSSVKCVEGAAQACDEFQTREEELRLPNGDPLTLNAPCKEGEAGCTCKEKETDGKTERNCVRSVRQFQTIKDFSCSKEDEWSYCPYYREQQEEVATEVEYDCETVQTVKKIPFLCIGGCEEKFERICKEKKRIPVIQTRQVPNCQGFDYENRSALPAKTGCRNPQYICKKWAVACKRYSVNEALHIVHEESYQRWRPLAIERGEYPKQFLDDIYLKFVSPRRSVEGCQLSQFERIIRGNTLFIKIPAIGDPRSPCNEALWDERNTGSLDLPVVYLKNSVTNIEERLCGRTEVVITADEIPMTFAQKMIPSEFQYKTSVRVGPLEDLCRHAGSFRVGPDLWFTERAPVRFSGTVSVLGKVLESVTGGVFE